MIVVCISISNSREACSRSYGWCFETDVWQELALSSDESSRLAFTIN